MNRSTRQRFSPASFFSSASLFFGPNSSITAAGCFLVLCFASSSGLCQSLKRYPRATPPNFEGGDFDQIFFADVSSAIAGEFPSNVALGSPGSNLGLIGPSDTSGQTQTRPKASAGRDRESNELTERSKWHTIISPVSLEDLVKQCKQRLDRAMANPAAFAGGAYRDARREFSLLALLLAIIEDYPEEVRWQNSAPAARASMVRVSGNIKGGARSAYEEARRRQQDLDGMLSGSGWPNEPRTEIVWEKLIDLVPLMQALEWAYQENVVTASANKDEFSKRQGELLRFAELIRVLSEVATLENMPYSDDETFKSLAEEMSLQAERIRSAVSLSEWELARSASGQIGQACARCHESFR
jgi:hypothetical protein